jgi:hypothetical protein
MSKIRFNSALIRKIKCENTRGVILAYDLENKIIKAVFEHSIDGNDNILKTHNHKDNKVSKVVQSMEFFKHFNIQISQKTLGCKIKHPIVQGTVEFSLEEG